MTLTQQRAQRLANLQTCAGYPKGELKPTKGSSIKTHAIIVKYGKRRIYRDETGQRWVKCDSVWWKFPEGIEY